MKAKVVLKTAHGSYSKTLDLDQLDTDLNITESKSLEKLIEKQKEELQNKEVVMSTKVTITLDW
jgi:hypothetical protein